MGIANVEKHRQKLWFSVLINIILLLFLLLVFSPAYETNDDMGMANIVNGAKGSYDPHLIFSHYFLGLILSFLYRFTDRAAWYPILQYAVLFVSFTSVTYVINRKRKSSAELWTGMIVWVVFAYEGYINLQFTKTAGIASAAGMFLIVYAIAEERIRKGALIFGFLIACTGAMYRMHQFYAEALMMTGIAVFQFWQLRRQHSGKRIRKLAVYLVTCGCLLGCVLGLKMAETRIYHQSEEWQEYLAYNKLRGKLYDYGFPEYDEYKEVYNEVGINKTAYNLYRTWTHMDTEKFTTDVMEVLYEIQPKKEFDISFLKEFFRKFPASFLKIPVFYVFGLLLLTGLICGRYKGAELCSVFCELIAVFMMYMYLYFKGRYMLNRVDVGLWFAASLCVLWIFGEQRLRLRHGFGILLMALTLFGYQSIWQERYRTNQEALLASQAAERAVLDAVQYDSEHLYLTKPKMVSFSKAYSVFDRIPSGSAKNLYSLGGWSSKSPVYSQVLESFGITNPFRDAIDNEKVYLVDNKIELTMKYIRKYYDPDAEAVPVFVYAPYQVYQIVTSE